MNNNNTDDNSIQEPVERVLPSNNLAEQMLIGSILANNENYHRVSDIINENHFYIPIHQKIFSSIVQLIENGTVASFVTLKNYFEQENLFENIKGDEYLKQVAVYGSTIINVIDYAKLIVDLAIKRELIIIGEDVVNRAYDNKIDSSSQKQLELAEQELFNLAENNYDKSKGFVHIKQELLKSLDKIENSFKHKDKVTGISSGFVDLDKILGGFQNSDLLILAGRPSMGKTAVVVNMAYNAVKFLKKNSTNNQVGALGVFSLEMSGDQLATRLISMISGISTSKLRNGDIEEKDFVSVIKANKELNDLPIFIDDTPALSISALRTRARRLKRQHNLSMIVVDYLQLLRGSTKNDSNRVQEISEITQGLKAIAKELDIPVIALSQLSRAVEAREDKRPLLSDLRESGSIEQDADIVMFIFREDYYLLRKQPKEGTQEHEKWQLEMDQVMNVTDLIIAKQRNGPIGNVKIHFDSKTTKFTDFVDKNNFL